ncbi:acid protease [Myriangium duriaei CBS 260.36]|uniref:Acid protease n=1 Tax=Myriangium duriaei CBS 260.36 TaxID=1168546 RepID=A0A9P4J567_9PEZI|nr:acid protease [Myriangium duriaei CBS 260.36]
MHHSHSLLISALACLASAAPASQQQGLTFSLDTQPISTNGTVVHALEILKTYNKYNAKAPAAVVNAAKATGTVNATNIEDVLYTVALKIGNQTFNVQFDTGSSDLWVWSSLQPAAQRKGHTAYVPGKTATKLKGSTWNVTYASGQGGVGVVYTDKVSLGSMTVNKQAVEAATNFKGFKGVPLDGILGMGFRRLESIEPKAQPTLFDNIKSSLASPLFTSRLRRDAPGTYDFGFIDKTKYTGNISYVNVVSPKGYWGFNPGSYKIGNKSYTTALGHSIADTGTSLMYLSPKIVALYYAKVSGAFNSESAGGWVFPCSAKLPAFQITIGTGEFDIGGTNLNAGLVEGQWCFGGLQSDEGVGGNLLGDVFLRAVFTVWDQSTTPARLGFAKPT